MCCDGPTQKKVDVVTMPPVDTELPPAVTLADGASNPTVPAVGAFGMVWNGATWDRAKGSTADGTLVNLGANNDVTVTSLPAVDTELPAATTLGDASANPTAPAIGAFGMVWNGATWDRLRGSTADGALVNLGANNDVTVTSLPAVDTELPTATTLGDAAANPTAPAIGAFGMVWNGATWDRIRGNTSGAFVQGSVAYDVAAAGNPIPIGGKAVAIATAPTAITASGRRTETIYDAHSRPYVKVGHPNSITVAINITNTTEVAVVAAQGANTRIVATSFLLFHSYDDPGSVGVYMKKGTTDIIPVTKLGPGNGIKSIGTEDIICGNNEALNVKLDTASRTVTGYVTYNVQPVI